MPAAPVTGSGLNPSTLNKLKRVFKGDADLTDLTQRVETLETNFTVLSAAVGDLSGFKITGENDNPNFTNPTPGTDTIGLYIDRFSEVGDLSIDAPNCTVLGGITVNNLVAAGDGVEVDFVYDGSLGAGSYPFVVALIGEDGSTNTWSTNIVNA